MNLDWRECEEFELAVRAELAEQCFESPAIRCCARGREANCDPIALDLKRRRLGKSR
jgi:hypothetical protein